MCFCISKCTVTKFEKAYFKISIIQCFAIVYMKKQTKNLSKFFYDYLKLASRYSNIYLLIMVKSIKN